jgi:hypothetical protein
MPVQLNKGQGRKISREVDMNFEGYDRDKSIPSKISSWRASHINEYSKFRQILKSQQRKAKRIGLQIFVEKESKLRNWSLQRPRSKRQKMRKIRDLQSSKQGAIPDNGHIM